MQGLQGILLLEFHREGRESLRSYPSFFNRGRGMAGWPCDVNICIHKHQAPGGMKKGKSPWKADRR